MKVICLLFPLFATTLFSALPPLAQSSKELQALLSDSQLQDNLGSGELIQEIIRTENGYVVMTRNYLMRVDIHYPIQEQRRVGPVSFELHFNPPISLETGQLKD